jgi:hypothetical protein
MARIHPDWAAMFAGNDVTATSEVFTPVFHKLRGQTVLTGEVVSEVVASYRKVRLEKAEATILRSMGWTLDEFKAKGKSAFPDFQYRELTSELQEYRLDFQIMLAGFGEDGGIIATVEPPGVSWQRDLPGFHAIGSGYFSAISSLFERELHIQMELREVLYYVYEAKVAAENAAGVGMETDLFVLRRGQKLKRVPASSLKVLESLRLQLQRRELTDKRKERVAEEIPKLTDQVP